MLKKIIMVFVGFIAGCACGALLFSAGYMARPHLEDRVDAVMEAASDTPVQTEVEETVDTLTE